MARKSTIVVSTKIPRDEYEYLHDRVEYLYKSNLIGNCTIASYMKFLIQKDLDYVSEEQYQNIVKTVTSVINILNGLPGIQSHFPSVLLPSVRIIGADSIPPCE